MAGIQLSLFGRTSWERFHQMTGWILEPCSSLSQISKFQCLLVEDGHTPEWCEGDALTSHGDCWTPNIGESPGCHSAGGASSSWQILEANVPEKYYSGPAVCSRILRLADKAGCPPPKEIEYLLLKQGGKYPGSRSARSKRYGCGERRDAKTQIVFWGALENPEIPFPLY